MQAVVKFIKQETVLVIAALLAIVSMFFVAPDSGYAGYIDYQTLALLFCLMIIMCKLQKMGVFQTIGVKLLQHVNGSRQLYAALVLLCFFSSMLIIGTNLGGLGTLIASMASLISYKQVAKNYPEVKGSYIKSFTVTNVGILAVMLGAFWIMV